MGVRLSETINCMLFFFFGWFHVSVLFLYLQSEISRKVTAGHSQVVTAVCTSQYCFAESKGSTISMKILLETGSETREPLGLLLSGVVDVLTTQKRLRCSIVLPWILQERDFHVSRSL